MSSIDLIKAFQTLGCKDDVKCAIASMVFTDLRDVCKAEDLQQLYDEELDFLYFRGKRMDCDAEIIIPVSNCADINLLNVEEIQRKLSTDLRITMAICDPNSTILYYTITNRFLEK